jgi:hypothetical protein
MFGCNPGFGKGPANGGRFSVSSGPLWHLKICHGRAVLLSEKVWMGPEGHKKPEKNIFCWKEKQMHFTFVSQKKTDRTWPL